MASGNAVIFNTELDESGLKSGLAGLTGKLGSFAKGAGSSIAAAAARLGEMTAKAVGLFGDLEQSLGGSEAVFAQYADSIQKKSKSAYKDMGLYQADYLATANKMGSLFKGAGFETEQAMDMTTAAMQRAADVASIMGLNSAGAMESVAGMAKGNFTMMDNLGVAMNDTTLQAYALENGIKKSTQSMTNAEKVSLAMRMFLEKTAYAVGNYAKENNTLSGSLQTAQASLNNFLSGGGEADAVIESWTNYINVLAQSLGALFDSIGGKAGAALTEALFGPKDEVSAGVQSAVKSLDDFNRATRETNATLSGSLEDMQETQAIAFSMLNTYDKLAGKAYKSDADIAQMKYVAKAVVKLFPELGSSIDPVTGLLTKNTTAIRDNIAAMTEQARAAAYLAATTDLQRELLDINVKQSDAQIAASDAWSRWQATASDLSALRNLETQLTTNGDCIEQYAGDLIATVPSLRSYFEEHSDGSLRLTESAKSHDYMAKILDVLALEIANVESAEAGQSAETVKATETVNGFKTSAAETTEQMNQYAEAAGVSTAAVAGLVEAEDAHAESADAATQSLEDQKAAEAALQKQQQERSDALQSLIDLQKQAKEAADKQADSIASGFELVKSKGAQSTKSLNKGINSQIDYFTKYADLIAKATERGVSTDILANFTDGSAESMAAIEGLVNASDAQLTALTEKYSQAQAAKEAFASATSEISLAENPDFQALDTMLGGISDAEKMKESIQKTFQAMIVTANEYAEPVRQAIGNLFSGLFGEESGAEGAQGAESGGEGEGEGGAMTTLGEKMMLQLSAAISQSTAPGTAVKTAMGKALGETDPYPAKFQTVGGQLAAGVAAGVTAGTSTVCAAVRAMIQAALSAGEDEAQINSPSRLFRDIIGMSLAAGTAAGVDKGTPMVNASVNRMINGSLDGAKGISQRIASGAMRLSGVTTGLSGSQPKVIVVEKTVEQVNHFNQPIQTPDEFANTMRLFATYGLAG